MRELRSPFKEKKLFVRLGLAATSVGFSVLCTNSDSPLGSVGLLAQRRLMRHHRKWHCHLLSNSSETQGRRLSRDELLGIRTAKSGTGHAWEARRPHQFNCLMLQSGEHSPGTVKSSSGRIAMLSRSQIPPVPANL